MGLETFPIGLRVDKVIGKRGVRMETLAIVMGLIVLVIFGYAVWVVTH